MASLIPPKKPRKPGMPKLTIPARPSSSSSAPGGTVQREDATFDASAPRSTLQHLDQQSQRPQPSLMIPQASSSSSSLAHGYQDEGYDDGHPGVPNSLAATIYPDTVPHLTNAQMQSALTDDLRRAIGGMSMADTEGERLDANGLRIPDKGVQNSSNGYWMTSDSASGSNSGNSRSSNNADSENSAQSHQTRARTDSSASRASTSCGHDDDLVLAGNFEILSRLGEGASGEVHKVRHRPTGLIMAKKTISTSPNPAIHRQILRELAFNRSCHSDYIVRYYGAFLEDQDTSIAICMEYAEAGSLDAIYKKVKSRNGRTGEKVLGKVAECVLKGLSYLHERKIIHRDIKPSNIVVTREGQIKLCDFGVSGELINSVAGTFTGTSYYMAPERIKGLAYTITSDVWSLGLTILEVASNRFPFPAEGEPPLGPIDLLSYVVHMKVPELQDDDKAGVKWSRALRDFIERCLEKEPTKRPGPVKMISHPFIRKSETRQPQPDIAKFVADVYGWSYLPSSIANQQLKTPTQATASSGGALGRIPSVRSAPVAAAAALSAVTGQGNQQQDGSPGLTPVRTVQNGASIENVQQQQQSHQGLESTRLRALPKISMVVNAGRSQEKDLRETAAAHTAAGGGASLPGRPRSHSQHRSQEERLAAKMREADVGLVGSPTTTTDDEGGLA
ncbi:related to MKK1 - MAP kinase kinase [Melanopsichium pennsylvanicum]|uniref:Related to MKK1 - MAP kinase kinase n=2 Tax=Melanopsichium pennsylvanicum TaxID=63383 RepID=A0AAJ4XSE4_9BASI|nr:related to MKK1-MAP kinase kinase [Melanopsichium pennsylvanicum 4]SNX87547.1 related to MKK1 - MAP kinase kinase [Melanopsichium pennsylvanicum]